MDDLDPQLKLEENIDSSTITLKSVLVTAEKILTPWRT